MINFSLLAYEIIKKGTIRYIRYSFEKSEKKE